MHAPNRRAKLGLAALTALALTAAPIVAGPASANTAGTGLVINEAFNNGGSGGSAYPRFVELFNPTGSDINLTGKSLQYRAPATTTAPSNIFPLTGIVKAGGYFLVGGAGSATNTSPLPTPDQTTAFASGGAGGSLFLANQTTALPVGTGSLVGNPAIEDLVGWGTSLTFEGTVAPAGGLALSQNRAAAADSDVNGTDFTTAAPSPRNSTGTGTTPDPEPTDPPVAVTATIAEIQGSTATSPLVGSTVTTRGIVTANYGSGAGTFNGYVIQTPGTGGAVDFASHTASNAVFVFSSATAAAAPIGSYVEVTGPVSEFQGLTEVTVAAGELTVLTETAAPVQPISTEVPIAQREAAESMLVAPAGAFTVTDTYDTNYFGSVVLNPGTKPLATPTAVTEPGSAEYTALVASNAGRAITLDDGASVNFNTSKDTELPYLSLTAPVRTGAAVTFTKPVILDYRFSAWNYQPTQQLTTANASTVQPATFANTRTAAPLPVGGDATFATFNVLNYFSTTGDTLGTCTYYNDRAGLPVTVNAGCDARGAANPANLKRQQDKIVAALNSLDADVVALEEIENSARFNKPRDEALQTLTAALNTAAGSNVWSFVPSPAALPASEDVIRTAFIYKSAVVETVGSSVILDDPAFANARQPLAQEFALKGGGAETEFLAIVNHFKSKGSGSGTGNTDAGDGQGFSNASRVAQAQALVAFANMLKTQKATDRILLSGDFNAYLKEDPIDVILGAGFVDLGATTGKETYSFDGASGSLDHIFASGAANESVTGVDIWNINSVESIALEYSRYNYNALNFYAPDAYRSSDHDPIVAGLALAETEPATVDINLLNINDFHGRIDANTIKFAGTVEKLRAEGGDDNTLFLSDGDNIGASLFASSSQKDQPTIDVLNALELDSSAVGNHEFDQGFSDLTGRVDSAADWSYLGANVYLAGTTTPALDAYDIFEIDGVRVAVIGAVTEETPSLVSPGGISTLEFGDPVVAVNRVVTDLKARDLADVFIAEYHEGAGAGTPDGATLEQELALTDSAFAEIVKNTTADVDAIFTGHTHKQYVWNAQVPGAAAGVTRPVLQTGSYGENVGQIVLTYDNATDDVVDYTARNVARITTADDLLVSTYPRVAQVKTIVTAALAAAAQIGNVSVGTIAKDITSAYIGTARDDRASESALGNLVADSFVETLADERLGGAEIGVVNPGGLRAELFAGNVTYSQANAVLPFANNLWTTTLTGAQFKTLLEQQWQRTTAGAVPSRPYLALGLSDNVNYTYDATLPEGSRITSITVDDKPIDPTRGYRIGTVSFLLEGGDNFHVFKSSTAKKDSGLVDRDAWIDFITDNSPLSPSFDRRGVAVMGAPTEALDSGFSGAVLLSKLNLTSLGSPLNTTVSAYFEGSDAKPIKSKVSALGSATAIFTVPRDLPAASTLVLVANESGTTVRIPVTINPDPVITGATPTIEGTPAVGETLTAVAGTWAPADVELAFQWKRSGVAIAGATEAEYALTPADFGKTITVTVTGSHDDLPAVALTSTSVTVVAGTFDTTVPVITGRNAVGVKLTATVGAWTPVASKLTYRWLRNGASISGASKATYTTTKSDAGKAITVLVTGTATGFTPVSVASEPVVVGKVLTATPTPRISGKAAVGKKLVVTPGTWKPSPVSLSVQWYRNGVAIDGAISKSYVLKAADRGKTITVKVKGSKVGYTSKTATSKKTSKVK
ncbi:ExeM/NucH family extracellular endonuclease [Glaciihabitans arcticus]|uniref:ExeM/NucH family extracellular endonuclease n=1 Tax=Glaciihabitans arcticus TaxID=2668039 RepID=A0A4Q9GSP6_9MICO|nr:ExeM/NucH family extracellular endonuclease [Glaciihabitans arcticus]TBN58056.1 ExeM/NucH family extracellular endonuclease [Glaciihabitans arcticus]